MADIEQIDGSSLPEIPKSGLVLEKTLSEMETEYSEQYLIRLLVDKINELIVEVNTIKNS